MGYQRRHARFPEGREVPNPRWRERLDTAVARIHAEVERTRCPGIYDTGDGTRVADINDPHYGPLVGPGRGWTSAQLPDGRVLVVGWPGDSPAVVTERVYRALGYATRHTQRIAPILDQLYAAVGHGWAPPVPPEQIRLLAEQILARIDAGDLPRALLAYHALGVRELLELPAGPWERADDQAARTGREQCAATGGD